MQMITQATAQELRIELAGLLAQQEEISGDIEAIKRLLKKNEAKEADDLVEALAPITFASQVRDVLLQLGKGDSKQIARILGSRGIKPRGRATLVADVGAELARMHSRGTGGVTRIGKGIYTCNNGHGGPNNDTQGRGLTERPEKRHP